MKKWLNGVHVPHRKNTAEAAPVPMTPSAQVVLPMSMHIGRPAVPLVKVGDTVKVGQKMWVPGRGSRGCRCLLPALHCG